MIKTGCAIIGAGIAGVAAAVYARRAGLDFILFEKGMLGGQLMYVGTVDNYPGLPPGSQGQEIYQNLSRTLQELDISPASSSIESVDVRGKELALTFADDTCLAEAMIVASGASMRTLEIPGETRLRGKGVSYCAVCDGFFFKDKTVAVIGGGNTAVEEAVYLSRLCKKVYLIHRRDKLRALEYLQEELRQRDNVEILWNTVVKSIEGKSFLEEVSLENSESKVTRTLALQGLFVAIGIEPNTSFVSSCLKCDQDNFIITDEEMRTSLQNVFACGDCRKRPLRQLITAAGEGAVAAISAYRYLKGNYISS